MGEWPWQRWDDYQRGEFGEGVVLDDEVGGAARSDVVAAGYSVHWLEVLTMLGSWEA